MKYSSISDDKNTDKALRILLVEDDFHVSDLLSMVFSLLEHDIKIVRSANEALVWAADLKPNIIYTNLLFNNMTGFELCARLRQIPELSDTRIVALTGLQFPELLDVCRSAGFSTCLTKPFSLDELAKTIDPEAVEKLKLMSTRFPQG